MKPFLPPVADRIPWTLSWFDRMDADYRGLTNGLIAKRHERELKGFDLHGQVPASADMKAIERKTAIDVMAAEN